MANEISAGKLYLVGTPIGNLGDISPRAAQTLEAVDFIAAEDTRVSLKLLNHLGIKKPLISYHEHNQLESGEKILRRLLAGESCAVVTDAGMPAVSDPGEGIVVMCRESGVPVEVIPGPCALVCAAALSPIPTQRFTFEGFLSRNTKSRREHLAGLVNEKRAMIFYEAPHKLLHTLNDLREYLGDRRASLCREITKLHEEVITDTLTNLIALYDEKSPKGEYVIVIEGANEEVQEITMDEGVSMVLEQLTAGSRLKDAVKMISDKTGLNKNALYDAALKSKE
ncbi:MAG: 16S rRNA (cytidine(1402)-2'-O)-methyltransferase [Oscillospiraceae bacterium]|nr:16S rRNA (cytidine(1402)-2'-O)-methyltransferase [Oscillospiraceae bacterium]